MFKRIAAALLLTGIAGFALAQMSHGPDGHSFELPTATLGTLEISGPVLRATPPNAPAAGGFITITNTGTEADRLISARIDAGVAKMVQLHEMKMEGDVMRMSEVAGGIALPAGETVQLMPGGLHLMIMGLAGGLSDGDHHDITLTFANAGEVTLNFAVMPMDAVKKITGGSGHMGH